MKTPNHPDVHDLLRIVTEAQSKKELKKRTAFDFPWRGFRKTVPIMCTADSVFAYSKSVTETLLLHRLRIIGISAGDHNLPLCCRIIHDDFSDPGRPDYTAFRVFNAVHDSGNIRLHLGLFE